VIFNQHNATMNMPPQSLFERQITPAKRQMMKRIFLSVLGWILFSQAIAQSIPEQDVSFNYRDVTVSQILSDIGENYELQFSYGSLDLDKKVNFQFKGSLLSAVEVLCEKQGLLYKQINNQIVLKKDIPIGKPIKGVILDLDSQMPLIGANVVILNSDPIKGASSDVDGFFRIENLKVGRYDLVIDYLGYEPRVVKQVLVTTGKEVFLNIELKEATIEMSEVVITATDEVGQALNAMATTSSRSFSIEEASRFAAAISDPARMALSFAGVTGNGDDLENEIVIRGNSSKGLLWRLEGIEIPNPNHFSSLGSGGGSVSMLSASTLSNSDFYTGAFPAEFGNALSGVFDLQMRRGNNEKREHSFRIGTLGVEASSEGYIKKGARASYLINYRFSTIALINKIIPTVEGEVTEFQDLSFKVNLPTKKAGVFSIFGLGGINSITEEMEADTSDFRFQWQLQEFKQNQGLGVLGVTHKYVVDDKSYMRTSLASSIWSFSDETIELDPNNNFNPVAIDVTEFREHTSTFNILYNRKLNAKNTFRVGYSIRAKTFDYDFKSLGDSDELLSFLENKGSSQFMDAYIQWKYRVDKKWEVNVGINASCLVLNKTYSVDPRLSVKYQFKPNQSFSLSTGLYSKPEHVSTYFVERRNLNDEIEMPNIDLPMLKAMHIVGAYDLRVSGNINFKTELYYQHLYDIPVGSSTRSNFSTLNSSDIFSLIFRNDLDGAALIAEGTGENYGIDLTLEKSFSGGDYFMITGSLFDSKFTTADGREYRTRYATNVVSNILGGKEWTVGKRNKNILGVNAKFNYVGGLRTTPILEQESLLSGSTVFDMSKFNAIRQPAYYRFDLGVSYKINKIKATHSISADIQNVTNRLNVASRFYDPISESVRESKQFGLIPFINYKIEF